MMLKWKSYKFGTIANNVELLDAILAGAAGKNRVIKYLAGTIDADIYLRVYRDADQFVNLACDIPTTSAPLVPVDIPLADGQQCKAGFYNEAAGDVTPTIAIGYEETG